MSAISDIDICYSDIRRKYVGLKTIIPISEQFRYRHLVPFLSATVLVYIDVRMSDIGYRIKVYSNIRYNVVLRSLQSDIGSSDNKLSLISLIMDIGVSAHLWLTTSKNIEKIGYEVHKGASLTRKLQ